MKRWIYIEWPRNRRSVNKKPCLTTIYACRTFVTVRLINGQGLSNRCLWLLQAYTIHGVSIKNHGQAVKSGMLGAIRRPKAICIQKRQAYIGRFLPRWRVRREPPPFPRTGAAVAARRASAEPLTSGGNVWADIASTDASCRKAESGPAVEED